MYKFLLITILAIATTACAYHSSRQVFKTDSGEDLTITGTASPSLLITVYINGETVIDSIPISSDEMLGLYNTSKVRARCRFEPQMFGSKKECDIYVDGKYAANLYFR
ncbi:hypothetical protein MTF66_01260 [Pseudoalteromonas sp. 2CM39R]|uniref:hypothetical protein n=1 Tax=Pseudoalteromonas sp. 2CM39R TaxID=2929856 RepID=UPI0020C16EEF|nr:hypothetical protein [Pseudoalteromonas sp. 2CM39R]MCK8123606.1 hypothetical protein [Pseudoalteromonas sp. 2CM39R]